MDKPATSSEYDAFKRLARGLVAVPKKEVEQTPKTIKARKKRKRRQ